MQGSGQLRLGIRTPEVGIMPPEVEMRTPQVGTRRWDTKAMGDTAKAGVRCIVTGKYRRVSWQGLATPKVGVRTGSGLLKYGEVYMKYGAVYLKYGAVYLRYKSGQPEFQCREQEVWLREQKFRVRSPESRSLCCSRIAQCLFSHIQMTLINTYVPIMFRNRNCPLRPQKSPEAFKSMMAKNFEPVADSFKGFR